MKVIWTTMAVLAICGAIASTSHAQITGFKTAPVKFEARLSGAQEVNTAVPPGVVTSTAGQVNITFASGLQSARFSLTVNRGNDIILAHFHCAVAGVNGPVVVDLFTGPATDINGVLASGTIRNANIKPQTGATPTCPIVINNMASLLNAMLNGMIYANVHSVANAGGEVRGQLLPIPEHP